jgi:hypothetical protein
VLASINQVPKENLKKKLMNHYLVNMDYKYVNWVMSTLKMNPIDDELEQAISLIRKEFAILQQDINQLIGGEDECAFKIEVERSLLVRDRLQTIN